MGVDTDESVGASLRELDALLQGTRGAAGRGAGGARGGYRPSGGAGGGGGGGAGAKRPRM